MLMVVLMRVPMSVTVVPLLVLVVAVCSFVPLVG